MLKTYLPIRNYINDLIDECNINIKSIPVLPTSPQMPQWEHINAKFDTDYTDLKKSESTNILACLLYTSPSPRDVHKSRMPSSA